MEVGFSAEEGDFPYLPADLVGKAWPMIFGTVQDCPALQVNKAVEACTLAGVGIITGQAAHAGLPLYENGTNQDQGQTGGNAMMAIQMGIILEASGCWHGGGRQEGPRPARPVQRDVRADGRGGCLQGGPRELHRLKRQQQIAEANDQGNGANPIPTVGGEDFPQNTPIWININGGSFYGQFQGNNFYISDRIHHEYETEVAQDKAERTDPCPPAPAKAQKYDYRMDVPCFCSDFGENCQLHKWGWVITRSSSSSTSATTDAIMRQFWADPGAKIVMESDEPLTYIASIVPGTVLAVKAFKQFQGPRDLVLVPPDLYTVQTKQYGTITTVEVVMNKPLSTIIDGTTGVNQGWSDDVYVTFQSSVGPDTIDIIKYLITNYTDLGWDDASFNRVQGQLRPFPANFPLLDRKNVIEVLKDIAFQARCAIWLADGKFYLKYLPEEPAADDTVTVSDLDAEQGVEVELTRTEDIVTKMNVKWRISYAPDNEYTLYAKDKNEKWIILRHNVAHYGTQEKDYDWYIYNQPDIILKCATFWLIRLSNTWKRVKFRAFLNKLNLETFDTLLFDDRVNGVGKGYLASSPMKLVVEQASYNSADNYIDFQCLAPVRAGSVTQDPYFWPSVLPVSRTWPSAEDIASGNAGGGGIGSGASGDLPVGYTDGIGQGDTVFVGGPNVVFRPQSDWGDRTPTDAGFHAQSVVNAGQYAELRPGLKPVLHLRPTFLRDMPPLLVPDLPQGPVLDLSKTKVMDASTGDRSKFGYLRDVLSLNPDAGRLEINLAQAKVSDDGGRRRQRQVVHRADTPGGRVDDRRQRQDRHGRRRGRRAVRLPVGRGQRDARRRDGVFARRLTISQESQRWQTSGFRVRSSTLGP